jgi:AmmeMemoRadiSam system protein B
MFYGFAPVGEHDINKILRWMNTTDGGIAESIRILDAADVYNKAVKTTMCGYIPVTILTSLAKSLAVKNVRILKYATSYDVQGSRDAIVGYLSMVFSL